MCAGLALFSAQAQTPLDIRVALVIGNGAYSQVPRLDNAARDAQAVAESLRSLGFTVEEVRDADHARMAAAVARVRSALQGRQGLGMLYYAGHGVQVDWRNYMLPVDARLATTQDVVAQAMEVGTVVQAFKSAGTRMNILVLDACRDNPFAASGGGKGLAPMDAPPGTLLAYATQPGNVAEDGDPTAGNGPYAQSLTAELRRPFAKVEDVFKRVRYQVRQKTAGRQIPWESTSLEEDFVFNDGSRFGVRSGDLERMAAEARQREQQLIEQARQARERERQIALELERERQRQAEAAREAERVRLAEEARRRDAERLAALERQREEQRLAAEGRQREQQRLAQEAEARQREQQLATEAARERERQQALALALQQQREAEARRLREAEQLAAELKSREELRRLSEAQRKEREFAAQKAEWDRIRDSKTASDVYAYLQKYPNGPVSELAQARIEQLDKPRIQPVADQSGQVQAFQARRFRLGDSYQFVVRDLLTQIEAERPTFRVVAADEETAEFNQGYKVTQAGAIIRTIAGATLDPYQQWIPSGVYQVGQKWMTRSILTPRGASSQWVELTGRVVARETITVPAGSFDTYKMEMEQVAQDGTRLKITYWGQPEWGVAVKQIREIRDTRGQLSGQIYEMLSRTRGP